MDTQVQNSKGKKIELVLQQLNSLPTLPAIAARLLQLTVKSDTQAEEVVKLIESDPSLASKIIALSTSASTGISRSNISLSKAVVLLGFDAVRNAVLSIKVFETLKVPQQEGEETLFDAAGFWKHSLSVACTAKMLVKHIAPQTDPEEAFVCGLLHDIGKLALLSCLPKSYNRVVQLTESGIYNIANVELKVLGLDHTIAGKRLAERWELPESVIECIWLHHQWAKGLPEIIHNRALVQAVHLADILTREQRIGYSGNHSFTRHSSEVGRELGCPEKVLESIARKLREQISQRSAMLGIDELEPEDLYHEALSNANDELGQLNYRLQQQNSKLRMRSDYFELMVELARKTNPRHSTTELCGLITDLWQKHTQCPRAAVYVKDDNNMIIEGMVKQEQKANPAAFLVDQEQAAQVNDHNLGESGESGNYDGTGSFGISDTTQKTDKAVLFAEQTQTGLTEQFAVRPINEKHYWFFEQVSPVFEMGSTYTIPLLAGGKVIGEIIWQEAESPDKYVNQKNEIQAFAHSAALTLQQSQIRNQLSKTCEQMAQSNETLQNTQTELLRACNLATVGEMAAGAAHEINNPLAVIVGRSQLLASGEQDGKKKEILTKISEQGQEIKKIITELMEFAQPALPEPSTVPIYNLVKQAADRVHEHFTEKNITLETKIEENIPDVFIDGKQITEALFELTVNAVEAYDPKDQIVIQINCFVDDLEGEVVIEIADKGCGMDQDTLKKATDPFFSAKPAGRKRGLGLSRSIRNIENNHGKLQLDSWPGEGTIARVMLATEK